MSPWPSTSNIGQPKEILCLRATNKFNNRLPSQLEYLSQTQDSKWTRISPSNRSHQWTKRICRTYWINLTSNNLQTEKPWVWAKFMRSMKKTSVKLQNCSSTNKLCSILLGKKQSETSLSWHRWFQKPIQWWDNRQSDPADQSAADKRAELRSERLIILWIIWSFILKWTPFTD